ncbi:hypothetical protein BaRGS_00016509 [Batillaria attramentaria]|uniref:Regulator of microtubule dynamics protein 1 n=1 Tax=Batillaria attramentaria TaxID=370345 RepID=A0ABD0KYB6_9CAEN
MSIALRRLLAATHLLTRFVRASRLESRRHCDGITLRRSLFALNKEATQCLLPHSSLTDAVWQFPSAAALVPVTEGRPRASDLKWACLLMATPLVMHRHESLAEPHNAHCKNDVNFNSDDIVDDVNVADVIAESEELLKEYKYEELYTLLSRYTHVDNDELLWRLARASCAWAKVQGEKGHEGRRKELMEEGFTFAQRALQLNDKSSKCHSWYATMTHYTSEFHGIRTHYLSAFTIRDHYEKAVSLDPADAVSLHSLGYWCFAFAHLPWYQRKLLAVLFRSPPNTTFEQALEYFYKAEEASPGFFSMNLVMAGRAHWHLHQYQEARDLFTRACRVAPRSPDERQVGQGHLARYRIGMSISRTQKMSDCRLCGQTLQTLITER